MAGWKLYMSEPGTVSLLVYAELAKGSVRAPLLPRVWAVTIFSGNMQCDGQS